MNTIHSSSLATYPSGYIKPDQDRLAQNRLPIKIAENPVENIGRHPDRPASTPEQIKSALIASEVQPTDSSIQNFDNRTQRALQTYNQTREQLNQNKLEGLISRVDYYA